MNIFLSPLLQNAQNETVLLQLNLDKVARVLDTLLIAGFKSLRIIIFVIFD